MPISPLDYKNQYAMFGAMTSSGNGMHSHKVNASSVDFGQKSIEGIGGQAEEGKVTGTNPFTGANVGFVDRLNRIDETNTLGRPTHTSLVEGYDNGLAKFLDLDA